MHSRRSKAINVLQVVKHRRRLTVLVSAKIAAPAPAMFFRSYLYTYLLIHARFTILIINKIVSNDLATTVFIRLASYITLYNLTTSTYYAITFYCMLIHNQKIGILMYITIECRDQ